VIVVNRLEVRTKVSKERLCIRTFTQTFRRGESSDITEYLSYSALAQKEGLRMHIDNENKLILNESYTVESNSHRFTEQEIDAVTGGMLPAQQVWDVAPVVRDPYWHQNSLAALSRPRLELTGIQRTTSSPSILSDAQRINRGTTAPPPDLQRSNSLGR
jgi:hypothetical protein